MHKIIQTDNFNSNSDLYINGNEVYKIYNKNNAKTEYNLRVINDIFKHYKSLSNIKELVLPKKLLTKNGKVVGFTMDYIKGYTLYEIINNNLLSKNEIKEIFIKILNVINKFRNLPFDFYLGDLHEKNVIIDENKNIHIIDPDGFVINNKKFIDNKHISMGKYLNKQFDYYELSSVKLNGDYICLLHMIIFYLFRDYNIFNDNLIKYISYLTDESHLNALIKDSTNNRIFTICQNDIEYLFNKKFIIKKDNTDYQEQIAKELIRIRKLI